MDHMTRIQKALAIVDRFAVGTSDKLLWRERLEASPQEVVDLFIVLFEKNASMEDFLIATELLRRKMKARDGDKDALAHVLEQEKEMIERALTEEHL